MTEERKTYRTTTEEEKEKRPENYGCGRETEEKMEQLKRRGLILKRGRLNRTNLVDQTF